MTVVFNFKQQFAEVVWMNEACAAAQRQHRFEYSSHTSCEKPGA